jgi:hypothetical protein
LSDLVQGRELAAVDIFHPLPGTWYREEAGETVVGASHRSVGGAIGALLFGLFWNGIVSVFVLIAIAGTIANLGLKIPHWFPAPNMNGSPMGVGMTIFLWIFLTPFIAIGMAMIGAFLTCIAGRTEVRVQAGQGLITTGIGRFGWRRRFETSNIKAVTLEDQQWRDSDGDRRRKSYILLSTQNGKDIKLGSMLPAPKQRFVAAALKKALAK